jgi:arylsulfatase
MQVGMALVQPFLDSFKEFPPRQKAASFTLDQALDKMASAGSGPSTTPLAKSA